MALTVRHATQSSVPDEGVTGEIGPSEWNEDHAVTGTVDAANMPALTGDVTTSAGAVATTLATVNSNIGTFGSATKASVVTVNAKGLVTAASESIVTPAASSVTGAGDLTKVDDTNVTLTLGGTPTGALLKATSITVGWSGTLAAARLNTNVVQSAVNDTNVTGSISAQALTIGWTGTLAASRGGTGLSALGTGVATFLATPNSANLAAAITDETGTGANVFATSPSLVTPILDTPTSGTLTNCTGLPVSTGISGLGTGVATFLATPSSANLVAAVSDETGTGALVFGTSPSLTTPVLTSPTVTIKISPTTDDGAPLGDTTHNFSDLFLASGSVINWNNNDITLTHSANLLTLAGAGSGFQFTNDVLPTTDGAYKLGSITQGWRNIYLSAFGVVDFSNGDVKVTHATNELDFTGASTGYFFDSLVASSSPTSGIGYSAGAGGTVTQATSRTTGVTLNKVSGAITLFTAAGSATAASFTVTNSAVAATDTISLSVKSGTNKYLAFVTAVAAGSFEITFNTTGGTSSDAPVINFNAIKGVAA